MPVDKGRHPRHYPDDLPATGAWREGDPIGNRQFVDVPSGRPFALEGGGTLRGVRICYETFGSLAPDGSNAVLVCHALTGDAHASGRMSAAHPTPGWWGDLVGPGRAVDTDRYFVVCVNVLGGCQGTTGPASIDPATGHPYGSTFPVVSIRDMVRAQAHVADAVGVRAWRSVVGGSMGGMQVLEWAVMYPRRVRSLVCLASTAAASAQQIAWSAVGRTALALDPAWQGGDYYDAGPGGGPHAGLAVARAIAQITYRTTEVFEDRFGRESVDPLDTFDLWQRFQVEGYLDHHGVKLARRFDANSYLVLNRAMDLHDIGRGRGGATKALSRSTAPAQIFSISSDALYPPSQQHDLHRALQAVGTRSELHVIESPQGHDGFLLETAAIGPEVNRFLDEVPDDH